jgi:hypothetical protein
LLNVIINSISDEELNAALLKANQQGLTLFDIILEKHDLMLLNSVLARATPEALYQLLAQEGKYEAIKARIQQNPALSRTPVLIYLNFLRMHAFLVQKLSEQRGPAENEPRMKDWVLLLTKLLNANQAASVIIEQHLSKAEPVAFSILGQPKAGRYTKIRDELKNLSHDLLFAMALQQYSDYLKLCENRYVVGSRAREVTRKVIEGAYVHCMQTSVIWRQTAVAVPAPSAPVLQAEYQPSAIRSLKSPATSPIRVPGQGSFPVNLPFIVGPGPNILGPAAAAPQAPAAAAPRQTSLYPNISALAATLFAHARANVARQPTVVLPQPSAEQFLDFPVPPTHAPVIVRDETEGRVLMPG